MGFIQQARACKEVVMQSAIDFFIPVLIMAAPVLLLVAGLAPTGWANANPRKMTRLNGTAAWLAFASALVAALLYPFSSTHA
jgi:NAD(P)H-quinone oxidoreductase subunit 5